MKNMSKSELSRRRLVPPAPPALPLPQEVVVAPHGSEDVPPSEGLESVSEAGAESDSESDSPCEK